MYFARHYGYRIQDAADKQQSGMREEGLSLLR